MPKHLLSEDTTFARGAHSSLCEPLDIKSAWLVKGIGQDHARQSCARDT